MCNYPFLVKKELDEPRQVPCGQCMACRLEKARQWSVRIMLEAGSHDVNSFLSLTYRDEELHFVNGLPTLYKRDLQLFLKNLRRRIEPIRIRYYACGEYGSEKDRPHYHVILFGYDFPDRKFSHVSKANKKNKFSTSDGYPVYKSEELDSLWKKGDAKIGDVSFESAGYVARYANKKITGDLAPGHYKGRLPEFAIMSRRPGIGKEWYAKFKGDIYPKDYFHINGVRNRPTRYFDELYKKENPKSFEEIKERRKEKMKYVPPIRRRQKEKFRVIKSQRLIRRMENETS